MWSESQRAKGKERERGKGQRVKAIMARAVSNGKTGLETTVEIILETGSQSDKKSGRPPGSSILDGDLCDSG